ncbi:MAG: bifunctional DNA-formamidopyrimidine glycosylase/DNA-(apurinic or apyrimidinic site) lyase [Rhodoferax sp.]|uniref:bifunctional DNA-formamidopyrimidine glycosylase/DNA-(apurinic or apyrimidinic site) lyase n=1 Tax=Rhodoferax sp. TaxID=50421 RepID=UPI001B4CF265|nr:bifunctional DNA-formamidopyrimidine glycosylase/DNA-(apurinic or apyrimidinic site) lyase [Rhodoferax sp.]MBP9904082.1 bifunctional DNA-formamidopyrimidine glycosylase/DNA-(apurinic or apyrimidinic site) lyase [Rhodoferax sp.]
MPELPEVEVSRRSFANAIAGAQVTGVRVGKPLRWPLGIQGGELVGRRVDAVTRRAKYLVIHLDRGYLLLHLGMSGSLLFAPALPEPGSHDHFDLRTTQGTLRLHDPRRFGAMVYVDSLTDPMARKLLDHLGMEPLGDEFSLALFSSGLKRRTTSVKQALMAGDLVVGVGNIYASEALFLAGIRPNAIAKTLSRVRVARLHQAIVDVLSAAVAKGGSTLRDFSSADGQAGHFQLEVMVYGRANLPCKRCETAVRLIRQGQRSSFYCPQCQQR